MKPISSVKDVVLLVVIIILLGWIGLAINTLYDYTSQKKSIENNIQEKVRSIMNKQQAIIIPVR